MTTPTGARGSGRPPHPGTPEARPGLFALPAASEPPPGVDYTQVLTGPGKRPTTLVGGVVVAALAFMVIVPAVVQVVILGPGFLLRGRPQGSFTAYTTSALGFAYPEGMLAAHLTLAGLIPVTLFLVRYLHQRRPVWLTSVQPGMRWRYLVIVALVALVVLNGFYWLGSGHQSFQYAPKPGWIGWIALIVLTAPLQAAGEEYLFRGYLTQVLGSFVRSKWLAVAGSSLLFALAHGVGQNWPLFVSRLGFGALMGVLVVVTGGLEAAIAAHAVNNVCTFVYATMGPGGAASAMAMTSVTWSEAAWNLTAYAVIGLMAWTIGSALRVARTTPPGGSAR